MKILKIIRCVIVNGGHQWAFRKNIHDDDRAMAMGARSVWACTECPAIQHRAYLHEEEEVPEPWFDPAFQRETKPSCTICCAKAGEPHLPSCPENETKGSSNAE